jgi:hypothetical protein
MNKEKKPEVTYSLLPSLYVCSSKSDCCLSVTSAMERRRREKSVTKKKEGENKGERGRKRKKTRKRSKRK